MRAASAGLVLALLFLSCGVDQPPDDLLGTDEAALVGPAGTAETPLIAARSRWQYHAQGVDLGTSWRMVGGGAAWPTGAGPLGYGEPYVITSVPYGPTASLKYPTTYFKRAFDVIDRTRVKKLYLRVMYDDGFAFYINGKEGGRASMPAGTITYGTLATGYETGNAYVTYDISAQITRLVDGPNSFAIEVHQAARSSSDLVMDVELIAFVEPSTPPRDTTPRGIPEESIWSYWDQGGDLGTGWRMPGYVERNWEFGHGPLGHGEPYISTTTQRGPITTYFRHDFTSNGNASGLYLEASFDDGFVAYLNGTEIHRAFMPSGPITANTLAKPHEGGTYIRLMLTEHAHLIREGVNTIAIEVHQVAASSSDLVWDARLVEESAWQPMDSGTTADLNDVDVITEARAWVVGAGGTMLRTQDEGQTWTPLTTGTTAELTAIQIDDDQFNSQFRGLAVGADGTILFTLDGETWTDRSLAVPVHLTGFSCDWPTCYAVARGDGDETTADLYVSTNNGHDWAPLPSDIAGGSWAAVYFQDEDVGWIAGTTYADEGGTIFGTTDGGATWTRQWAFEHHGGWPMALAPQWDGSVWMVGETSSSGHGEIKVVTRDGVTWEEVAPASEQGLFDVSFTGSGDGYAVGLYGQVVATHDGGDTWVEKRAAHYHVHGTLNGLDYSPANTDVLYAVGSGGTILVSLTGADDRGWVQRKTFDASLSDVGFVDDRHGWMAGDDLYETRDGGESWIPHPKDIHAGTIELLGSQHVWVGGFDVVWASRDGGVTFTPHTISAGVAVTDLAFTSPTVGWATVENEFTDAPADLFRTLDGGATWQPAPTGVDGNWTGIVFTSAQHGWLAGQSENVYSGGDRGTILRTIDGGVTWTLGWHPGSQSTIAYQFEGISGSGPTVWAVGSGASIWGSAKVGTRDGGTTWIVDVDEDGKRLDDVHFVDASHGWAVGLWGAMHATDDGGATWQVQVADRLDLAHVSGVHFTDQDNGWASGSFGFTFETSTGGD